MAKVQLIIPTPAETDSSIRRAGKGRLSARGFAPPPMRDWTTNGGSGISRRRRMYKRSSGHVTPWKGPRPSQTRTSACGPSANDAPAERPAHDFRRHQRLHICGGKPARPPRARPAVLHCGEPGLGAAVHLRLGSSGACRHLLRPRFQLRIRRPVNPVVAEMKDSDERCTGALQGEGGRSHQYRQARLL